MSTIKQQLVELKKNDRIRFTLKDIDRVRPSARGKTVECVFSHLGQEQQELVAWCYGDVDSVVALGHELPVEVGNLRVGFHEWLIESLEVIE